MAGITKLIMKKKYYKAEYTLSEIDEQYGTNGDPYECEVGEYESIENLKSETIEVLEKMIADKQIADGKAQVEMQIVEKINGVFAYIDNDAAEIEIKDGKVVGLAWPITS